jgi:hypothetical protein
VRRAKTAPRKVVIVGPDGRETAAQADVSEAESDIQHTAFMSTFLLAILLIPAIFFPPLLMLNLPLLFLRSYLSQEWASMYEAVLMPEFTCPACGAANPAQEHKGTLPFETKCAGCGATLAVRPPPRRNLALPQAQQPS